MVLRTRQIFSRSVLSVCHRNGSGHFIRVWPTNDFATKEASLLVLAFFSTVKEAPRMVTWPKNERKNTCWLLRSGGARRRCRKPAMLGRFVCTARPGVAGVDRSPRLDASRRLDPMVCRHVAGMIARWTGWHEGRMGARATFDNVDCIHDRIQALTILGVVR